MSAEEKLKSLGLGLPNVPAPIGNYVPFRRDGQVDLFVAVLGERGKHARSAVGMGSLPNRITVEIEAVMRVVD